MIRFVWCYIKRDFNCYLRKTSWLHQFQVNIRRAREKQSAEKKKNRIIPHNFSERKQEMRFPNAKWCWWNEFYEQNVVLSVFSVLLFCKLITSEWPFFSLACCRHTKCLHTRLRARMLELNEGLLLLQRQQHRVEGFLDRKNRKEKERNNPMNSVQFKAHTQRNSNECRK